MGPLKLKKKLCRCFAVTLAEEIYVGNSRTGKTNSEWGNNGDQTYS